MEVDNTKRMVFADIRVQDKAGKPKGLVSPAKFIFKKSPESPTTEVAMLHSLRDDLYVVVGTINPQTKTAAIQIHVNPLVSWIWLGCIVLIAGSIVCMWPQLETSESRVWSFARSGAAVAASLLVGLFIASSPSKAFAQSSSLHSGTVHIEDENERSLFSNLRCMCGGCARDLLSTCACNVADDARSEIRLKLANGKTKEQIIAEYAAEYGPASLAVPPNKGGLRAIYVVPVVAIVAGAVGLAFMMRRWRRKDDSAEKPAATKRDEYDARLDEELKDLDG
jgi:cytochrome c-type biogenesis protein CcmF